jgi:hypothetical protein
MGDFRLRLKDDVQKALALFPTPTTFDDLSARAVRNNPFYPWRRAGTHLTLRPSRSRHVEMSQPSPLISVTLMEDTPRIVLNEAM